MQISETFDLILLLAVAFAGFFGFSHGLKLASLLRGS